MNYLTPPPRRAINGPPPRRLLPKPYYDDGNGIVIYCGQSEKILPMLRADVVLTDPPYGVRIGSSKETRPGLLIKKGYASYDDTPENYKLIVEQDSC